MSKDGKTKPQEMIQMYSEHRLTFFTLVAVVGFTAGYMTIVSIPWAVANANTGYGVLPTFALGYVAADDYTLVSLYFFVFGVFAEGMLFAFILSQVRNIKKEFAML